MAGVSYGSHKVLCLLEGQADLSFSWGVRSGFSKCIFLTLGAEGSRGLESRHQGAEQDSRHVAEARANSTHPDTTGSRGS